ncbi:GrpB family protein [Nocardia sp. NPDC049190]|uniref:GrpB family protein n=1 Tax=Nocardia sp. NPDC049190 TaxID=3155650 RepID=UPI0033E50CDB
MPGLAAKSIVDILLVIPDTADEEAYVPALDAAGYTLRIREPDWHQHRCLIRRTEDGALSCVNLLAGSSWPKG